MLETTYYVMRLVKKCVICNKEFIGFEKYCDVGCLENTFDEK